MGGGEGGGLLAGGGLFTCTPITKHSAVAVREQLQDQHFRGARAARHALLVMSYKWIACAETPYHRAARKWQLAASLPCSMAGSSGWCWQTAGRCLTICWSAAHKNMAS